MCRLQDPAFLPRHLVLKEPLKPPSYYLRRRKVLGAETHPQHLVHGHPFPAALLPGFLSSSPRGTGQGSSPPPSWPFRASGKFALAPLYPGITDLLISLKASYLKKLSPQLPPH